MNKLLERSEQERVFAGTLQDRSHRCFFCKRTASGEGLPVELYDPKTVQQGIGLQRWHTTKVIVPRCKRCANVDTTLKRNQTAFIVLSLILIAIGCVAGIFTYDYHQMDSLPVLLAGAGFLLSLGIFVFRTRKLYQLKGSGGVATMKYLDYEPIKYLREHGWKLGTGG